MTLSHARIEPHQVQYEFRSQCLLRGRMCGIAPTGRDVHPSAPKQFLSWPNHPLRGPSLKAGNRIDAPPHYTTTSLEKYITKRGSAS